MQEFKTHKKIIYIIPSPFFQRDFHRFGCEYLMSCGYDVEIWYIPIDGFVEFETQAGMYTGDNLYVLSKREYSKRVSMCSNDIYIYMHSRAEVMLPLVDYKCTYILYGGFGRIVSYDDLIVEQVGDTLEDNTYYLSSLAQIKEEGILFVMQKRLDKYIRFFINNKYIHSIKNNPPTLIMTSVQPCLSEYFKPEEIQYSKKNIITHSFDYDRYIETNRLDTSNDENCILYIDSGIYLLSYDAKINNLWEDVREHTEEYFDQLDYLFEKISEHYCLPIVIAGHPHTQYPDNAYNGREIVFNKTCELVKHAKAVITTSSTAISFVALYDKPMVHIYNSRLHTYINKYTRVFIDEFIKYQSKEIEGVGVLNMDNKDDMDHPWDFFKKFDEKKRDLYIHDYIIDTTISDKTTYEVLEEEIRIICDDGIEKR